MPLFICFKLQSMVLKKLLRQSSITVEQFRKIQKGECINGFKANDMYSLLSCVRLLFVLCPAAIEHILHAKAQSPSPLVLLLILSGKRFCPGSCQNDAGNIRRGVFKLRYISPKIIWKKEKSKFQNSCIDRGLHSTLSIQGFCFTGIMRNTCTVISQL